MPGKAKKVRDPDILSAISQDIILVFEKHREAPGTPFDPKKFEDYFTEDMREEGWTSIFLGTRKSRFYGDLSERYLVVFTETYHSNGRSLEYLCNYLYDRKDNHKLNLKNAIRYHQEGNGCTFPLLLWATLPGTAFFRSLSAGLILTLMISPLIAVWIEIEKDRRAMARLAKRLAQLA